MTDRRPCHRHPRGIWSAGCTGWYLAAAVARRDEATAVWTTARPAARPTARPTVTPGLRLAA
jgi:hypothetical protein